MRISCHFERSAAESRNLVLSTLLNLSTLLKTGLTDLSTSARYNPAFGRDDNGASFNHNWYYIPKTKARPGDKPNHAFFL